MIEEYQELPGRETYLLTIGAYIAGKDKAPGAMGKDCPDQFPDMIPVMRPKDTHHRAG
jgi:hypothetical protein